MSKNEDIHVHFPGLRMSDEARARLQDLAFSKLQSRRDADPSLFDLLRADVRRADPVDRPMRTAPESEEVQEAIRALQNTGLGIAADDVRAAFRAFGRSSVSALEAIQALNLNPEAAKQRLESVNGYCQKHGWTDPHLVEGKWRAFPPGAVMSVPVPREEKEID